MDPESQGSQLLAGQLLADRYVVKAMIGHGGMAEVYSAEDRRLARSVALKVLRPQFSHDAELRHRFEREARAAAAVSHPNVVAVYDAGEDDQKAFIVMELVAGESLEQRIRRGPLDSVAARSIGVQVLQALKAAHDKGVLHRDIKPANILLTPEGEAKVADFGIAKALHPSPDEANATTVNVVLGTPSYLAPERAQGEQATPASDIWSVGVLLYECLTGTRPFRGDNAVAVTLAARTGRFEPVTSRRPGADPLLSGVIAKALSPEPGARFQSAGEMAAALEGGEPALAEPGAGLTGLLAPTALGATSVMAAGAAIPAGVTTTAFATSEKAPVGAASVGAPRRRLTAVLAGAAAALAVAGVVIALIVVPHSGPGTPSGRSGSVPTSGPHTGSSGPSVGTVPPSSANSSTSSTKPGSSTSSTNTSTTTTSAPAGTSSTGTVTTTTSPTSTTSTTTSTTSTSTTSTTLAGGSVTSTTVP